MPRKLARSDAQVERLAAQLHNRWTEADGIMPWLRRHLSLLTRLNQDEGWSWSDIGRALDAAGITYESGRPWSGFLLGRKVAQARAHLRSHKAARTDQIGFLPARHEKRVTEGPAPERRAQTSTDGEAMPNFAQASLAPRTFTPPQSCGEDTRAKALSPARKRVDVDAVIRRLQGCDVGSDNEG